MSGPTPIAATLPPVVLYDTTLRDGTQGENIILSLADKLRIARMLDEYGMPYIEGGWPAPTPRTSSSSRRRKPCAGNGQGCRVRLHPAPRKPPRGGPEPAELVRPRHRS